MRFDERPFRVALRESDADRLYAAGWLYATKADYEDGLQALRCADVSFEAGSDDEARDRHVREFVRCVDPSGNSLEIGWGNVVEGNPFVSPTRVTAFVMDELGLGHIVLPGMHLAATRAFYVDILGFADSDGMRAYLQGGGPDDPGIGFHFLHCDNPRHHSLAIGEYPAPSGVIHMMFEVRTLDDVGRALDRAIERGAHISASLGKHTNDKMISFYVRSDVTPIFHPAATRDRPVFEGPPVSHPA